jgi:hypothetical protein
MGAPPEVIAQARRAADQRSDFSVLPCNLDAVNVFWAMSTQWRIAAGMAGAVLVGLDYTAIPTTLRMLRIPRPRWPAVFDALRVMELAALKTQRDKENR